MEVIEEVVVEVDCWKGEDAQVFVPIQDSETHEYYISSSALESEIISTSEREIILETTEIAIHEDGIQGRLDDPEIENKSSSAVNEESVAAYYDVTDSLPNVGDGNTKSVVQHLKCPKCDKTFELKNSLSNHIKSHSEIRQFKCSNCERRFKKSGDYQRHLKLCGEDHQFKCDDCGKTFMSMNSLTNHARAHNNERPFQCEKCSTSFKKQGDMKNHERICKTGVLPFSCGVCQKQFAAANSLANHILVHQQNDFFCSKCGKEFKKPGSHLKHERSCQSILSFGCIICETKFTSEEQLKRHEKVHVNERLQCDICLKTFTHPNGFAQHKKSHIEQRFDCSVAGCEQVFKTSFNLKKHIKSHKVIKKLDCDICGRHFGGAWNLKRHMLTHAGVKPFQCNQCPKSFTCEKDMNAHMTAHSGQKGFQCPMCPSAFTHLRGLQQHVNIHSDKAKSCTLGCGKKFLNEKLLIAHSSRCKYNPDAPCNSKLAEKFGDNFQEILPLKKSKGHEDLIFRCKICDTKFREYDRIQCHVAEHSAEEIKDDVIISIETPIETEFEDYAEEINTYVISVDHQPGADKDKCDYHIESHVKYILPH
eukprot:GFUD01030166.1.p1 GENE.GFUD01030166.1~~GFUD01030166.1.p1  ORF type:complete len:591 (+),score=135.81 GFUD01030166.1:109-1881(+)